MLYQTTQEHEAFRQKMRGFAESEVKPIAFMLDQNNEFPAEAVKKLGEMGLMGIPYPKEYGGAGLDVLSYAIAVGGAFQSGRRYRRYSFRPCIVRLLAYFCLRE